MLKCTECELEFKFRAGVKQHFRYKHADLPMPENFPGTAERDPREGKPRGPRRVVAHALTGKKKVLAKRGVRSVCPECKKTFSTPQVLGRHRLYEHAVKGANRRPDEPYVKSALKTKPSRPLIRVKMKDHADPDNPMQCRYCDHAPFNAASGLRYHLGTAHQDKLTGNGIALHSPATLTPKQGEVQNGHAKRSRTPATPIENDASSTSYSHEEMALLALVAKTAGTLEYLVERVAFNADRPARDFTARVAKYFYELTCG